MGPALVETRTPSPLPSLRLALITTTKRHDDPEPPRWTVALDPWQLNAEAAALMPVDAGPA
ncbi:MAG: hypothetical protein ACRDPA_24750 [Solirubrobacteraceae bacterium]